MTKLKILHFDIEALPGHWIGGDYVSKIPTAIAYSWADEDEVSVFTHYEYPPEALAFMMAQQLESADIVTGHYIRRFDLPLINGELLRAGYAALAPLTTSDTKDDVYKAHGRSKSQKNLSAMLEIEAPKVDVTLRDWEGFNQKRYGYEQAGIDRVVGDVIQHKQLRKALLDLYWLGPTKTWRP